MFLTPGGDVSANAPNDKVVHLLTFAVLAITGRWAGVAPLRLGVGLVLYAGATELLQSLLPIDRHGDVRDLAADVTGVLLGLFLSRVGISRVRTRAGRAGD
jgi:VanZ family protein